MKARFETKTKSCTATNMNLLFPYSFHKVKYRDVDARVKQLASRCRDNIKKTKKLHGDSPTLKCNEMKAKISL